MKKFLVLVSSLVLSVSLVTGCGGAKDAAVEEEEEVVEEEVAEEEAVEEEEAGSSEVEEYIVFLQELFNANQEYYTAMEQLVEFINDEEALASMTEEEIEELGTSYGEMIIEIREVAAELESMEYEDQDIVEMQEVLVEMFNLEANTFEAFFRSLAEEDAEGEQETLAAMDQLKTLNEQLAAMFE